MPLVKTAAPTIGKTLGISTLAGLASEGASQLMKKITGGQVFQIPNMHFSKLATMSQLLTPKQIQD